jgi:hypothetical protein
MEFQEAQVSEGASSHFNWRKGHSASDGSPQGNSHHSISRPSLII